MNGELHPLEPFLPANARILMLGSFPPKRIRWSMDFFYPNLQNDMWRIVGYLAAGDKSHFLMPGGRKFDKERIEAFCRERGIALYDTAVEVIRLKTMRRTIFFKWCARSIWRLCWRAFPTAAPSLRRGRRRPIRCAPSRAAANQPWAKAWLSNMPDAACGCGACRRRRGPIRGRSSGRPDFTAKCSKIMKFCNIRHAFVADKPKIISRLGLVGPLNSVIFV